MPSIWRLVREYGGKLQLTLTRSFCVGFFLLEFRQFCDHSLASGQKYRNIAVFVCAVFHYFLNSYTFAGNYVWMISVCLDPSMTVPCTTLFHGNSGTSSSYSSPLFLVGVGDVLFFQAVFLACTPFSLSEVITTRIDITGEKRGSTVAWHRRRVETGDTWLQASDMCRRFDELYNTWRNRFNRTRVWERLCVCMCCVRASMLACINVCVYVGMS